MKTPPQHCWGGVFPWCPTVVVAGTVRRMPRPFAVHDLWAKTSPPHRLDAHLLDTAAAALWLWDNALAPSTREWLNVVSPDGDGRRFAGWVAAMHDCGKTTPAFQSKDRSLGAGVHVPQGVGDGWPHTWAGAVLLRGRCRSAGWGRGDIAWLLPLIAGHHGQIPTASVYNDSRGASTPQGVGLDVWEAAQRDLLDLVTTELGYSAWPGVPRKAPSRAQQLELAGFIVQCDWIASHDLVPPQWGPGPVTLTEAQTRIGAVATSLGITGGWGARPVPNAGDIQSRFDWDLRPLQSAAADAARALPTPGLLILEAATGEGKTEAAFAAAEILAARSGRDGIHMALPTQATTDAMWGRMSTWARRVAPDVPQLLTHGKAGANTDWRKSRRAGGAVSRWYLDHDRSLLAPVVVSTIDVLLHTAVRTRHVALRASGAFRKVLIIDEVHASDTRMHALVCELLRWAGNAGTPVVLLSATLPSSMRDDLSRAYAGGATNQVPSRLHLDIPATNSYPRITGIDGNGVPHVWGCPPRPGGDRTIHVAHLERNLSDELAERLADGGVAMIVRNTVARAQTTAEALREEYGDDVILLHSRLTTHDRTNRTTQTIRELGPGGQRPRRRILVGTQVLEQSLDIDADLLITDHAPIDLLLQRAGRMHRHETTPRPNLLTAPVILIDGINPGDGDGPPTFPAGAEYIYGQAPLLAAAAVVGDEGTWHLPADTPALIEAAETPQIPEQWAEAWAEACTERDLAVGAAAAAARQVTLGRAGHLTAPTLAGLHHAKTTTDPAAVIRGDQGGTEVEVITQAGPSTLRLPAGIEVGDYVGPLDLRGDGVEVGGRRLSYDARLGLQVR